jgi:thiol-disulfide isomerase/thioredoxin
MHRRPVLLVLAVLGIVHQFAPVLAQDSPKNDPQKQEKPVASLNVGDAAPALKVTRWLRGGPVKAFEPGKVYVVEFWATWCGACIRSIPHLEELQARYKDRGVTIVSFTCRDIRGTAGNTEDKVAAFLKRRVSNSRQAFAYADDQITENEWLKGRTWFPKTFIVDKTGRVAYIGGPMFLEMALLKVLAGDASAKVIGDEMDKVEADYKALCAPFERDRKAFFESDPKVFSRALKEFEAKYPPLADCLVSSCINLTLLLKQTNPGDAKDYAERLVEKAIKQRNVFQLQVLNGILREKKENKELLALAVRAADALVRFDDGKYPYSLLCLAETYLASGDGAKAREYARKAIDASAGESSHDQHEIEKEAHRLGSEK